jgi:hypothetical protein
MGSQDGSVDDWAQLAGPGIEHSTDRRHLRSQELADR